LYSGRGDDDMNIGFDLGANVPTGVVAGRITARR
jgi:hypothetical protein